MFSLSVVVVVVVAIVHMCVFFSRSTGLITSRLSTKKFFGIGIPGCQNYGLRPFSRGNNSKIAKVIYGHLHIFLMRIAGSISTKLGTKHPVVKGI